MVDVVLAEPGMKRDLVDAEIGRSLFYLAAFADQCDRAGPEFWRIGAWHVDQLSMQAIS